jgi:hypothetical protein
LMPYGTFGGANFVTAARPGVVESEARGSARGVKMNLRRLRPSVLASSFVGIFTCCRLVDTQLPPDSRQFSPPVVYARWWAMTEACSGRSASMASVSWFEVPATLRNPANGESVGGYWSSVNDRIVLTEAAKLIGGFVRHEMLHALLKKPGHPREAFLGSCAGVVGCFDQCLTDAGPPPTPAVDAIKVTPDSLEISLEVAPQAPTMGEDVAEPC